MCCNPAPFRLLPHSSVSPWVAILLSYSEVVTRPARLSLIHWRESTCVLIVTSLHGAVGIFELIFPEKCPWIWRSFRFCAVSNRPTLASHSCRLTQVLRGTHSCTFSVFVHFALFSRRIETGEFTFTFVLLKLPVFCISLVRPIPQRFRHAISVRRHH
jgi:hypothetical protein